MRRQLLPATLVFLVVTVLCGVMYPLAVTAIAQVAAPDQANGSLVLRDGEVVGSALIGQRFDQPRYLHPRPSAAGAEGYDGAASGASQLGVNSPQWASLVAERARAYRELNGLAPTAEVPADAVTASGSGLDPHISPENARLQVDRVARARGLDPEVVRRVVEEHVSTPLPGTLGREVVNVLEVNLALDEVT